MSNVENKKPVPGSKVLWLSVLLMSIGSLCAFIAAIFAFLQSPKSLVAGFVALLFMLAGGGVNLAKQRRNRRKSEDTNTGSAVPKPCVEINTDISGGEKKQAKKWSVKSRWITGLVILVVVVFGLLLIPFGKDQNDVRQISPGIAFHLAEFSKAPDLIAHPVPAQTAPIYLHPEAFLTAKDVASINIGFINGDPSILVELTSEGGRSLAAITEKNIGNTIAIVDAKGRVLFSAAIGGPITGGRLQISGLTFEEVHDTYNALTALPQEQGRPIR